MAENSTITPTTAAEVTTTTLVPTTNSTSSTAAVQTGQYTNLPLALIIGCSVGASLGVMIVAVLVILLYRCRRKQAPSPMLPNPLPCVPNGSTVRSDSTIDLVSENPKEELSGFVNPLTPPSSVSIRNSPVLQEPSDYEPPDYMEPIEWKGEEEDNLYLPMHPITPCHTGDLEQPVPSSELVYADPETALACPPPCPGTNIGYINIPNSQTSEQRTPVNAIESEVYQNLSHTFPTTHSKTHSLPKYANLTASGTPKPVNSLTASNSPKTKAKSAPTNAKHRKQKPVTAEKYRKPTPTYSKANGDTAGSGQLPSDDLRKVKGICTPKQKRSAGKQTPTTKPKIKKPELEKVADDYVNVKKSERQTHKSVDMNELTTVIKMKLKK